jgi:DNA-binding CsgD family transcriptional regulator
MEAVELARIWKDLPLADQDIATRLDLNRQQVINLRKSARERLGRRLA